MLTVKGLPVESQRFTFDIISRQQADLPPRQEQLGKLRKQDTGVMSRRQIYRARAAYFISQSLAIFEWHRVIEDRKEHQCVSRIHVLSKIGRISSETRAQLLIKLLLRDALVLNHLVAKLLNAPLIRFAKKIDEIRAAHREHVVL